MQDRPPPMYAYPQKRGFNNMGRPRTPTRTLKVRGSFEKNPARLKERTGEPKVIEDLGGPPARLTKKQIKAWHEISGNAHAGVLSKADRHAVEMASILLAGLWDDGLEMSAAHMSRLETLLSKFGMNPSDRSRVKVPEVPEYDPADKFFTH